MSKNQIPDQLKQIFSLPKEEFNRRLQEWEQSFIDENGEDSQEEVADIMASAGEPSFGQVLFDERTRAWVRIQYGKKGSDYVYHIHFKREPRAAHIQVIQKIYESVSALLPRDPEKIVNPPMKINDFAEPWSIDCYTLIVKDIAGKPGSRRIMEDVFVKDLLNKLNEFFPKIEED